ncbi:hypothetical protein D3C76_214750 [compost metagenome]
MKGRVSVEYRRLGFFAVQTEDNYFSVIEVQSGLPSLGNKLIGELNSLGVGGREIMRLRDSPSAS